MPGFCRSALGRHRWAVIGISLVVAGIGIFCAVSAIHHHRVGQQALLASLGLSRAERGSMLLLQWGMLGLLCMVLVWPLGTLLAGYLGTVVTPAAFGWSFPLQLDWQHYLVLGALAAATTGAMYGSGTARAEAKASEVANTALRRNTRRAWRCMLRPRSQ